MAMRKGKIVTIHYADVLLSLYKKESKMNSIKDNVKEYYGRVLGGTKDLKTKACCCTVDSLPVEVREVLGLIDEEIISHYNKFGEC